MKKQIKQLTGIACALLITLATAMGCQTEDGDDIDPLVFLLLAGGGGGGTSSITVGSLTNLSGVVGENYSFDITKANVSTGGTYRVLFSTNSTVTSVDTLAGTVAVTPGDGTQTVSVTVPSSLASGTTPGAYYVGLVAENTTSSSIESSNQMMVFPSGSVVTAYAANSAPLTSQTLNSTTTQRYYEMDFTSGVDVVAAAYQAAGGLDVIGNVYNTAGSLTDINSRGANLHERLGINVTATRKSWIQIRRNGSTSGTFTFFANDQNILSGSPASGGGSCSGGTGIFVNRCSDFETGFTSPPTNNAGCVALQGTGSVYSTGACTGTNRIARCHALPLSNSGRIILNFYSPESTATATTVCNGDVVTIP